MIFIEVVVLDRARSVGQAKDQTGMDIGGGGGTGEDENAETMTDNNESTCMRNWNMLYNICEKTFVAVYSL